MCEECRGGHQTSKCIEVPTEEVNYMGGRQRPYNNIQQRGFQTYMETITKRETTNHNKDQICGTTLKSWKKP